MTDMLAPLCQSDEQELLEMLDSDPDTVRALLIAHNLRLVAYLARRFTTSGVDMDDLISIGTIGLIKAVDTFDPSKGTRLRTYASRCITNEILTELRRNTRKRQREISLDAPLSDDGFTLADMLGTDPDAVSAPVETACLAQQVLVSIDRLSARDRTLLLLRYRDGCRQRDIAARLGISQARVSRALKEAVSRLQTQLPIDERRSCR